MSEYTARQLREAAQETDRYGPKLLAGASAMEERDRLAVQVVERQAFAAVWAVATAWLFQVAPG